MTTRFAEIDWVVLVVVVVLLLPGISGCTSSHGDPELVPVPERFERLELDLSTSNGQPADSAAVAAAIERVVCLLRSGRADDCREPDSAALVCTARSEAEIRAALTPTFHALREVVLTSSDDAVRTLRERLPGAVVSDIVYDARRKAPCYDWNPGDGACAAVRVDKVWLLLHAPGRDKPLDRIDVFLAPGERACDAAPSP